MYLINLLAILVCFYIDEVISGGHGHGTHYHDHLRIHMPEFVHHDHHKKIIVIHHHPKKVVVHQKPHIPNLHKHVSFHQHKHHKTVKKTHHSDDVGHHSDHGGHHAHKHEDEHTYSPDHYHPFKGHHVHHGHGYSHKPPIHHSHDVVPPIVVQDHHHIPHEEHSYKHNPTVKGITYTYKKVNVFGPHQVDGLGKHTGYQVKENNNDENESEDIGDDFGDIYGSDYKTYFTNGKTSPLTEFLKSQPKTPIPQPLMTPGLGQHGMLSLHNEDYEFPTGHESSGDAFSGSFNVIGQGDDGTAHLGLQSVDGGDDVSGVEHDGLLSAYYGNENQDLKSISDVDEGGDEYSHHDTYGTFKGFQLQQHSGGHESINY